MIGTAGALGIGAGLGLLKDAGEQERFNSQKRVQSATTRYSPWTGMHADAPQYGSGTLGNLAGGAASGLLYSQQNPAGPATGSAEQAGIANKDIMAQGALTPTESSVLPNNIGASPGGQPTWMSLGGSRRPNYQGISPYSFFTG